MKTKLFLFLFVSILLVGLASADLGTFKMDTCVPIVTVLNATQVNITSVTLPNGTLILLNTPMTNNGVNSFNYSFCNNHIFGNYVYGYNDNNGNVYGNSYSITSTGVALNTATAIVYVVLITLIVGILIGLFFGIKALPKSNESDEEGKIMSVKWLKYLRAPGYFIAYILFFTIIFLASNIAFAYLGENLFARILFNFYQIGFMMAPLIVAIWVVWFFVKFFQDKKFQSLINRGLMPQSKGGRR